MARKNAIVAIALNDNTMSFTVEGETFNIDTAALSPEISRLAMLHGIRQKVSDAAALEKGATPSDKFHAMKAVAERLLEGEWSARRGNGTGPVAGVIYRAFEKWVLETAKAKKATAPDVETIRKVYDAKSRAEQLALKKVTRIAEIIEELKAEKGSIGTEVDTDSLLDELGL